MRDTWEIKQCVNQLIQEQTKQQEILVHVISNPNITRYTAPVNRHILNVIIDALQRSNEDLKIIQYYRGYDTMHQTPTNVHLHVHHTSLP